MVGNQYSTYLVYLELLGKLLSILLLVLLVFWRFYHIIGSLVIAGVITSKPWSLKLRLAFKILSSLKSVKARSPLFFGLFFLSNLVFPSYSIQEIELDLLNAIVVTDVSVFSYHHAMYCSWKLIVLKVNLVMKYAYTLQVFCISVCWGRSAFIWFCFCTHIW